MHRLDPWLGCVLVAMAAGLAAGCEESGLPDDATRPVEAHEIARVVSAQEALSGAHVPTLDPATMPEAEVSKMIGEGPRCEFRYTTAGRAALAMSTDPNGAAGNGVVKLNGSLVALQPVRIDSSEARARQISLSAEPIRLTVVPQKEQWNPREGVLRREAEMLFEVDGRLLVGYRGYIDCAAKPVRISHRR